LLSTGLFWLLFFGFSYAAKALKPLFLFSFCRFLFFLGQEEYNGKIKNE